MTKNRARKQDARARAARTGERYVVAQRAVAERAPRNLGLLHELTHRVPGVPSHVAHVDGNRRHERRNAQPAVRRHNEPRVLVGWQNWIARRLGVAAH